MTTKYGLALHTSSPALGLAIGGNLDRDDLRCQTWDLGRETSNYLHPYLLKFLIPQTWQDLDWIAVANGPGGFTGTRLGVVTVRTLAQQLDLPVFTISSLAAVVWSLPPENSSRSNDGDDNDAIIAISMPAQRGEVFGAVYRPHPDRVELTTILPDTVFSSADWDTELARIKPDRHHIIAQAANLADTVSGVWDLARIAYNQGQRPDWTTALPFYGQHPVFNLPIASIDDKSIGKA
jgi:tRNA threonylcarbamoyl adenosine modification protein YeaZ